MWKGSFRTVSSESPETMRKLCLSTKFTHQEFRWSYGVLRSVISHTVLRLRGAYLFNVSVQNLQNINYPFSSEEIDWVSTLTLREFMQVSFENFMLSLWNSTLDFSSRNCILKAVNMNIWKSDSDVSIINDF